MLAVNPDEGGEEVGGWSPYTSPDLFVLRVPLVVGAYARELVIGNWKL